MIDVLRSCGCKWDMLVNFIKTNKWYSEEVVFLRKMVYKGEENELFLDINIWVYCFLQN